MDQLAFVGSYSSARSPCFLSASFPLGVPNTLGGRSPTSLTPSVLGFFLGLDLGFDSALTGCSSSCSLSSAFASRPLFLVGEAGSFLTGAAALSSCSGLESALRVFMSFESSVEQRDEGEQEAKRHFGSRGAAPPWERGHVRRLTTYSACSDLNHSQILMGGSGYAEREVAVAHERAEVTCAEHRESNVEAGKAQARCAIP